MYFKSEAHITFPDIPFLFGIAEDFENAPFIHFLNLNIAIS